MSHPSPPGEARGRVPKFTPVLGAGAPEGGRGGTSGPGITQPQTSLAAFPPVQLSARSRDLSPTPSKLNSAPASPEDLVAPSGADGPE